MTEMMEMFKKTGAAGGRKRAANMTRQERSESARKAVQARWAKMTPEQRSARAKKAAAASAKVRTAKAKPKKKERT